MYNLFNILTCTSSSAAYYLYTQQGVRIQHTCLMIACPDWPLINMHMLSHFARATNLLPIVGMYA